MNKIKNILLVFLPLVYIIVSMSFISDSEQKLICKNVEVRVMDSLTNTFIEPADIFILMNDKGINLIGTQMEMINSQEIEEYIDKHPSILKSECYKTIGGTFMIDIRQRRPLIRVVSGESNYYIDSNGEIMPFSKHYTAFVPVVTGNNRYVNSDEIINALFHLGIFLDEDPFWKAQISQLHIEDNNNIIMIPRVGNHIIEFGSLQNMEQKFSRLKALYLTKFNKEGWNRYKKISVKFENQVVCTKK